MNEVTVLGRHAILSHGAIGEFGVRVEVGPAIGSQAAHGMVAHVVFSHARPGTIGWGVTIEDPDLLDKVAQTLIEAADALRVARNE